MKKLNTVLRGSKYFQGTAYRYVSLFAGYLERGRNTREVKSWLRDYY